jgi:serine/threonine protein kinase
MALTSGTKIGPYEIVSSLGAGGMGEVYRATDIRLGRDVAIKVLPEGLARDAKRLRRFETEARAVAALNHPNILSIHDIGTGRRPLSGFRVPGRAIAATGIERRCSA